MPTTNHDCYEADSEFSGAIYLRNNIRFSVINGFKIIGGYVTV